MTKEEFKLLMELAAAVSEIAPPDIQRAIKIRVNAVQAAHYAALAAEAKEQS